MDVIGQDSSSESESPVSESSPVEHTPADSVSEVNGDAQERHGGKRESGYSKAKRYRQKLDEDRRAFESERQQFQNERMQLLRERQEYEASKKPKRGYTLEELKGYTEQWQEDLEALQQEPYPTDDQRKQIAELKQLLRKAGKEAEKMQAEQMAERQLVELPSLGTQRHADIWHQCEAELRKADPDFQKAGSRIDKHLRDIMQSADGQHFRSHPRGIYAAYSEAQKRILMEDVQKLKEENQKLRSLTSIGGGVTTRPGLNGDTRPFERLSSKEMRERLLKGPPSAFDTMPFM